MKIKLTLSTGTEVELTIEELNEILKLASENTTTYYPQIYPYPITENYPLVSYYSM